MSAPTILIVEDETKIAAVLRDYLEAANYHAAMLDNGADVAPWLADNDADLVLLDIMLPGKDGLTVCRELRADSDIPIVMVTARVADIDRLLGLELGADDYICKPFNPREVVARVKAILRRVRRSEAASAGYRGLVIDEQDYRASVNGEALELTPVEFRLLQRLAGRPGRVYSREQLQSTIYLDGRVVLDRTVDSHVKNLRRKLRAAYADEEVIHSIYGVGYKFE